MAPSRILLIEDDQDIGSVLADDLRVEGYHVDIALDGESGLRMALEQRYDLVLLDLTLPRKDGFDVCRALRKSRSRVSIIMVTARAHEAEKVLGLELGADDYVTKPFSPRELRARIQAVLRRTRGDEEQAGVYRFADVEVDFDRGEVRAGQTVLDATPLEFKLLSVFIRRRGRVLSREHLIEEAWGRGVAVTSRVVDSHVVSLRRKIESTPKSPRYLVSVRGLGYRFDG